MKTFEEPESIMLSISILQEKDVIYRKFFHSDKPVKKLPCEAVTSNLEICPSDFKDHQQIDSTY
jgi:hypothetical protein